MPCRRARRRSRRSIDSHERDDVLDRHDRIADELAGAVVGDLAAAVDVDDGDVAGRPASRAGRCGARACRRGRARAGAARRRSRRPGAASRSRCCSSSASRYSTRPSSRISTSPVSQTLLGGRVERGGGLGPRAHAELAEARRQVALDRALGEEQLARDLRVRVAADREVEDLALAVREGGRDGVAAHVVRHDGHAADGGADGARQHVGGLVGVDVAGRAVAQRLADRPLAGLRGDDDDGQARAARSCSSISARGESNSAGVGRDDRGVRPLDLREHEQLRGVERLERDLDAVGLEHLAQALPLDRITRGYDDSHACPIALGPPRSPQLTERGRDVSCANSSRLPCRAMASESLWRSRLRWRWRGALQWPLFVVLTIVDAFLLGELPIAGDGGTTFVPALLLAFFFNLVARRGRRAARLAAAAPPPAATCRRWSPTTTRARRCSCLVTLGLVAGGLIHRPAGAGRRARLPRPAGGGAAVRRRRSARPSSARRVAESDTLKLGDEYFRTCVPGPEPEAVVLRVRQHRREPARALRLTRTASRTRL